MVAGGIVAGLALVGGAAFGAWSLFAHRAQPAEALPDSTLGYASIDLDPSGEQKIEAIKILKKFPAFNDEIDLDTDDDIRKKMFDEFNLASSASAASTTATTSSRGSVTEPRSQPSTPAATARRRSSWSRSRTRTPPRTDSPRSRSATARAARTRLGDRRRWAVLAETDKIAEGIADDAADSPLTDDEDYQKWTDEVGDAGVVNCTPLPRPASSWPTPWTPPSAWG